MKKNFIKSAVLVFGLGALVFASCSPDELTENVAVFSIEEIQQSIVVDQLTADVNTILDQDDLDEEFSAKGSVTSSVASCAVRTVESTATQRRVTIDFGAGCLGENQKEYAGKIIILYQKTAVGVSKTVSFDGFSINKNKIEGMQFVALRKANDAGNPVSAITYDIKITLVSGDAISRKGRRVREKIRGKDTRNLGDDVYGINGVWESTDKQGIAKRITITKKIIKANACKFLVSGIVEISKKDMKATLDFGNGSCDNTAILTDSNGNQREITLKD